jgi:hypothetical protein
VQEMFFPPVRMLRLSKPRLDWTLKSSYIGDLGGARTTAV